MKTWPCLTDGFFAFRFGSIAVRILEKFVLLALIMGWMTSTATASDEPSGLPAGWRTYNGNFFSIGVPPNFVTKPEGQVDAENRGDGVSLWNASEQVEFYVYSPQWNGVSPWTKLRAGETLDSHESKTTGNVVEEQWSIAAKDKSYVRFVVSFTDTKFNTNKTFGIRIPNMKVYQQIKPTYVKWKSTLQQFAD